MSLLAILLFIGTMALSLWATMRVRQVYSKFSRLPASSGSTGADTAVRILRQEGIYDVEIVETPHQLNRRSVRVNQACPISGKCRPTPGEYLERL
jgi:Zn-dependent membrane protease YugP